MQKNLPVVDNKQIPERDNGRPEIVEVVTKKISEKSLSREICLDLELSNEKPLNHPVFCRQVAETR